MLFLAMQVRVMAACMESQIDKQEYTASAQSRARDGTGGINQPSDVCEAYITLKCDSVHQISSIPGIFTDVTLRYHLCSVYI